MVSCCCDLCGSQRSKAFPEFITGPQRVVLCKDCGLIYTNPRWDEQEIRRLYEDEFTDDPGAPQVVRRAETQESLDRKYEKALDAARAAIIPSILRHTDPKGKRWLEVRFRGGAVLAEIQALGAEVSGVDLFEANVERLQARLKPTDLYAASAYDLLRPVKGKFDIISMMTIHVLAHVPSPTALCKAVHEKLELGGLLFIDEKDVTQNLPAAARFAFESPYGMAHFNHLTLNTARAFIEKAGFKIIQADFYLPSSAQRHFFIVAQKVSETCPSDTRNFAVEDPNRLYNYMIKKYAKMLYMRMERRAMTRLRLALMNFQYLSKTR